MEGKSGVVWEMTALVIISNTLRKGKESDLLWWPPTHPFLRGGKGADGQKKILSKILLFIVPTD